MILDQLPIARFMLKLQMLEDGICPPYKGELLHEGLSYWLSVRWCRYRQEGKPASMLSCENCGARQGCLYGGELIRPLVRDTWSDWMHAQGNTPPPAYALSDLQDRRTRLRAGDTLSFELTLIGERAIARAEDFISATDTAARRGLGLMERLHAQLVGVTVLIDSWDGMLEELEYAEVAGSKYIALRYSQAIRQMTRIARTPHSVGLRFLSPIDCEEQNWKTGSDEAVARPELGPLVRSLTRRLRLLSEAHGGGEWPRDESHPLEELAREVTLAHDETRMIEYVRKAKKGQSHIVRGFVGQAWYSGQDLRPLLPLLWFGQWVHLGKGYAYGNGRYAIDQVE